MELLNQTKSKSTICMDSCQGNSFDNAKIILAKYQDRIFNFIMKMTENYVTTVEITKEIFVEVIGQIKLFEKEEFVLLKLYSSAVKSSLAYFESSKRSEKPVSFLLQLKPFDRAVILLRDMENFSYSEISRILTMKRKSVRKNIAQARQLLLMVSMSNYGD